MTVVDRRVRPEVVPDVDPAGIWSPLAASVGPPRWRANLVMVEDAAIRELNARYRDRDEVTDVLSFSYLEPEGPGIPDCVVGTGRAGRDLWLAPGETDDQPLAGEVVLAPAFVADRCRRESWSLGHEMALLVVHGLLHILGWEHDDDVERRAMRALEAEILGAAGVPHPLNEGE